MGSKMGLDTKTFLKFLLFRLLETGLRRMPVPSLGRNLPAPHEMGTNFNAVPLCVKEYRTCSRRGQDNWFGSTTAIRHTMFFYEED